MNTIVIGYISHRPRKDSQSSPGLWCEAEPHSLNHRQYKLAGVQKASKSSSLTSLVRFRKIIETGPNTPSLLDDQVPRSVWQGQTEMSIRLDLHGNCLIGPGIEGRGENIAGKSF